MHVFNLCNELAIACKAKHAKLEVINTIYLTQPPIVSKWLVLHIPIYLLKRLRGLALPPFYPSQSPNYPGALLYYDKHQRKMTFLPQKFSSSVQSQPDLGQGQSQCQKWRSKVKRFKQESITNGRTDATKCIISLASRSITMRIGRAWLSSL